METTNQTLSVSEDFLAVANVQKKINDALLSLADWNPKRNTNKELIDSLLKDALVAITEDLAEDAPTDLYK